MRKKKLRRSGGRYDHLSYKGKLHVIFNSVFILTGILLIAASLVLSRISAKELYERDQEKLSVVSSRVEAQFSEIRNITTDIHQNSTIQTTLIKINNSSADPANKVQIESDAGRELNWLMVNKRNVSSVTLLDNRNEHVAGNLSTTSKDIIDKLKRIPSNSTRDYWFFDKKMTSGFFVHHIYNARSGYLKKLGTVIVTFDPNFIREQLRDVGVFSKFDFFILEYQGSYYTPFSLKESSEGFRRLTTRPWKSNLHLLTLSGKSYLAFKDKMEIANQTFRIHYFLLNRIILKQLLEVEAIFLLLIAITLICAYMFAMRYLNKLINPINQLAVIMGEFSQEADLENLKQVSTPEGVVDRSDEIGILYRSFQKLINEIQTLVLHNYQSRILTQEIEYKFLQAQIDPHFLFNTLNSINWLAINNGDMEISEMVTALALLFRKKISSNNESWSTISEEVELVDAYIRIQSVRFKSRLVFTKEIDAESLDIHVPTLIIQPLIENAIKYGVEKVNHGIKIALKVQMAGKVLTISIDDNGPGFSQSALNGESSGVGIRNIRSRLKIIYSDRACLKIETGKVGSSIRIQIPLEVG